MVDKERLRRELDEAVAAMTVTNAACEKYSNPEYTDEDLEQAQQNHEAAVEKWREATRHLKNAVERSREEAASKRFVVEICDDIGYTEDAFDYGELPEGLREMIAKDPGADSWSWADGEGGTWEAWGD
jgi:hypothetical protein